MWCATCMKRRPRHFTGRCDGCGERLYGICFVCFYLAHKGLCRNCASERSTSPGAPWIKYAELCPEHRGHISLLRKVPYVINCEACRDSIKRSVREKIRRPAPPRYRGKLRHASWDEALRRWIASCYGHIYDWKCCPWDLNALNRHVIGQRA